MANPGYDEFNSPRSVSRGHNRPSSDRSSTTAPKAVIFEKEILHTISNCFRDHELENSYQLYASYDEYFRAQYIMLLLLISHLTIFLVFNFYQRNLPHGLHILPCISYDKELYAQWIYMLFGIPFSLFPLRFLERNGSEWIKSGTSIIRRHWKRWAAFSIALGIIGMQVWTTYHAKETTSAFDDHIFLPLKCTFNRTIPMETWLREYVQGSSNAYEFLSLRNRWLYVEFVTAIATFLTVLGATLAISMRLDFPHVVFTSAITCIALWMVLIPFRSKQWKDQRPKTIFSGILVTVFIVVPATFVLVATYSTDRSRRIAYYRKSRIEEENNELRTNLIAKKEALTNHSITASQKVAVEKTLLSAENIFLETVAIPFSQLQLERILGSGSTSETLLAEYLGTKVAVKRLNRRQLTEKLLLRFKEHLELIACLRHPNIVQFIGFSYDDYANICLVMEYMEMGNVYNLLHSEMQLAWSDPLLKIATDAAQGMSYLHNSDPPVVHRDLKSSNLLCSLTFGCKVSDFGESKRKDTDELLNTVVGTPYWLAPEILREEPYDMKADCYSFGIVLVELETRKDPYYHVQGNPIDNMLAIAEGLLRPILPSACPEKRRELIQRCLAADPVERPTMAEILGFLQSEIKEEIVVVDRRVVPPKKLLHRQKREKAGFFKVALLEETIEGV